jgi:hypothetical protein
MANHAVDWERVYRESYPSVYRALAATLLDASLAQDALHDAFLEGLGRPPRHQANVPDWLFLGVNDLELSKRFYTEGLGWKIQKRLQDLSVLRPARRVARGFLRARGPRGGRWR